MAKAPLKKARPKRKSNRPDAQVAKRANTDKSARIAKYLDLPSNVTMFEMPDTAKRATSVIANMDVIATVAKRDRADGIRKGFDWWNLSYKLHKTATKDKVVCPTTYGDPCPICEQVQIWYNNYDANIDLIKHWRATDYNMYLLRGEEKETYELYLQPNYFFGKHVQEAIQMRAGKGVDDADYFYEHDGMNEILVMDLDVENHATYGTQYKASRRGVDFAPRKVDAEPWVDAAPALDDCIVVPTYDELTDIFDPSITSVQDDDKDEEGTTEEDDKPARGRRRAAPAEDEVADDADSQAEVADPPPEEVEEDELPDDEIDGVDFDAAPDAEEEDLPQDEPEDEPPFEADTEPDEELADDDSEIPEWTDEDDL